MLELAPILAGIFLGLAAPPRLTAARRAVLVLAALAAGGLVALLSSELAEAWWYLLIDAGLALVGVAAGRRLKSLARTVSSRPWARADGR